MTGQKFVKVVVALLVSLVMVSPVSAQLDYSDEDTISWINEKSKDIFVATWMDAGDEFTAYMMMTMLDGEMGQDLVADIFEGDIEPIEKNDARACTGFSGRIDKDFDGIVLFCVDSKNVVYIVITTLEEKDAYKILDPVLDGTGEFELPRGWEEMDIDDL